MVNSLLYIALAGRNDAKSDPGFGNSHWCAFGAVEISGVSDHLVGQISGHPVFGEVAVAIHGVEVELGGIHNKVVIEVLWIWHGV